MSYAPRRKYTHACRQCGTVFHPEGREQRYCSRGCSDIGRTLPRPPCERCGRPRNDLSPARRFCGRACASAAAVKERPLCPVCKVRPARPMAITCSAMCGYRHRKLRTRAPRNCAACGKEFMPYPSAIARAAAIYCSSACHRSVTALRPALVEVECLNCGARFRRTQAAVKRVSRSFCGNLCRRAYAVGELHPSWRGGQQPNRGSGWQRIAEAARERDGYRCRWCGKTQADNGQRLCVDHIRPWRTWTDKVAANDPENLASLCKSCHGRKLHVENLWLRGDVLAMRAYEIAVAEPWIRATAEIPA